MKQTLQPEYYGLTEMDANELHTTEGGSEIGYLIGQAIGWTIKCFGALADGASQSAHNMPGLK